VLTHHSGRREQPLSDPARAALAMERAALAQENLTMQAKLRARAAAELRDRAAAKR
jgi:hypothetical protein